MNRKDRKNRKRKVSRRSEDELDKCFSCPYENCKKEYASSLALNLHMKTKHNAGTKKQRDNYAVSDFF
jgi:transcription elongation factor Elf1